MVPEGYLPCFSVGTKEEARSLLVMTCSTNKEGDFVARELAQEQSLENLSCFSDRLGVMHEILKENGRCKCEEKE